MPLDFATVACPDCNGDGMQTDDPHGPACRRCKGAGQVLECTACKGKLWVPVESAKHGAPYIDKADCEHCDGTGAEPMTDDDRY